MKGASSLRPVWALTWPVRAYWLHSERKIGKRLLLDRLIKPLLPSPPRGFTATVPGGARVRLHFREDLGLTMLLAGGFESAELEHAFRLARPGATAIDVGANIGVHTAVLAVAVGVSGRVLAFEPEPSNFARLRENVDANGFTNVEASRLALSDRAGEALLHVATDPMYHSTRDIYEARTAGRDIRVETQRLDDVWHRAGTPTVSFVKIDTEGNELDVLRGAETLLARDRPILIVEARDPRIAPWLEARGYSGRHPDGFAVGNMLFEPILESSASRSTSSTRSRSATHRSRPPGSSPTAQADTIRPARGEPPSS